jgi:hypothetical protein
MADRREGRRLGLKERESRVCGADGAARCDRVSALLAAAEVELSVRLGGTSDLSRLTDVLTTPLAADCPAGG